jgi:hypothetical protein
MKDTGDSYVGNDNFYELYKSYLAEERVRTVHDAVLQAAMGHPALQRVVDLGCGQGNEFFHYGQPALYVGLDQNAAPLHEAHRIRWKADYRDVHFIQEIVGTYDLTAAVSLFSTELTWPPTANQRYYEELFGQTRIQAIFVAGGYAEHAEGEETILEAGNLVSYQTFGGFAGLAPTSVFDETRICVACPSTMFGEDIIEVYRLLQRPGVDDGGAAQALVSLAAPVRNAISVRRATSPLRGPVPLTCG